MKTERKHIHLMGIGGIGMSGLAYLMKDQGFRVSGCDVSANNLTSKLSSQGIKIFSQHDIRHLEDDCAALVYSSAIRENNPELNEARNKGIPVYRRAEMLAQLTAGKRTIAVTGSHGKTTVTAMITHILNYAGKKSGYLIGGEVPQLDSHARWDQGEYFVAETDESDGSQIFIHPEIAVITNLDSDHLEYYRTLEKLQEQMIKFINNLPKKGRLIICAEDPLLTEIPINRRQTVLRYGFSSVLDVFADRLSLGCWSSEFDLYYRGKFQGRMEINLTGRHNVLNALAALTAALQTGVGIDDIKNAIKQVPRIKRRLEILFADSNTTIIDDYAHHPTEIQAVISSLKGSVPGRLLGVFQPHRFTRTKYLYRELAASLQGLDDLVLTDIYSAHEDILEGISSKLIYDRIIVDDKVPCTYIHSLFDIEEYLIDNSHPQDTILFIGAGDISEFAHRFAKRIKNIYRYQESLAPHTTLRIGGNTKIWAEPKSISELRKIIREVKEFKVIGNGSNLLISDEDINCCVISLVHFNDLLTEGSNLIAGSGANLSKLVDFSLHHSLAGLEFLAGIPGTVGGAVNTNAGAWGSQIADVLDSLEVMAADGSIKIIQNKQLDFSYRYSNLNKGDIILKAKFILRSEPIEEIRSRISTYINERQKRFHDYPNAGSVFKNPLTEATGSIIDRLGLKGLRCGNAEISSKHGNIIINRGGATARDVWFLIEYMKKEVLQKTGIELELELECWGELTGGKQKTVIRAAGEK